VEAGAPAAPASPAAAAPPGPASAPPASAVAPAAAAARAPAADPGPLPGPSRRPTSRAVGTRGRRPAPLWRIRGPLGWSWRIGLSAAGIIVVLVGWGVASTLLDSGSVVLPTPAETWDALRELWSEGTLWEDLWASTRRVAIGYGISVAIGIVVGIAIGTLASVEAFFEGQIGFLRYIPASALTPVLMLWLGLGESPKIWLIVLGTVFFNILMVADVARAVPRELLNASATLGAGRWTIWRRVVFPYSLPGIVDVARINLAAAWLMLVVSELLAAQEGLAFRINLALRFRAVDTMFAVLLVFGVVGMVSDLSLRGLRNRLAPWARP
jgi:NitT/TauT family transport system permease protein